MGAHHEGLDDVTGELDAAVSDAAAVHLAGSAAAVHDGRNALLAGDRAQRLIHRALGLARVIGVRLPEIGGNDVLGHQRGDRIVVLADVVADIEHARVDALLQECDVFGEALL